MKKKSKKNIEYKSLLSALAHGSTDEAQKILAKNGVKEASTYEELEYELAKLYSNTADKIQLEKEFAEIHPHSKFILKYLAPKVEKTETVRAEDGQAAETETTPPTVVELTSNASGCGCEGSSSADGVTNSPRVNIDSIALVSIVAIVGLVILGRNQN